MWQCHEIRPMNELQFFFSRHFQPERKVWGRRWPLSWPLGDGEDSNQRWATVGSCIRLGGKRPLDKHRGKRAHILNDLLWQQPRNKWWSRGKSKVESGWNQMATSGSWVLLRELRLLDTPDLLKDVWGRDIIEQWFSAIIDNISRWWP